MSFSVVSWNVEHFGSTRRDESPAQVQARIHDVFELLGQPALRADVLAIYEVNGAQVYAQVAQRVPSTPGRSARDRDPSRSSRAHGSPRS